MAYQINYYADRAMRRRMTDSDTIGDILPNFPAPDGREAAYARHSDDASRNVYGYDGAWHSAPPAEAVEADRLDEEAAEARRADEEYAAQPHIRGFLRHDPNTLVVSVPGQRESAYLTMGELRRAARQSDPEGREAYSRLLAEAERLDHWRQYARSLT